MRKYLSLALAGAALAACQQQTAPKPSANGVTTETVTSTSAPVADSGTTATGNGAPAAGAAVVANTAGPSVAKGSAQPLSGYDWAEAHHIDDEGSCTVGDDDFKEGCKLYVQEKAIEEGESEFESDGG
uniref:hypothetical protein n=1 Tax=Altererythrobacter segetis TaxID=1104773 RepID=UPI001407D088|nr:hypothetical protein [Altererythrobacter segetis]